MLRSRLGLKVLGLCGLVLGVMAFVAGGAQAESAARWNVAGVEVTGVTEVQTEIKEIENKTGQLLFTTKGGTKVAILCTSMKWDEGGRLIKEGGVSLGRVLFTGCITLLNGTVSTACKPKSGGKPLGELLSEKFKGLIVLDKLESGEVDDFVKITPDEGNLFMKWELGSECSIGEIVKIESKSAGEGFWVKDCKGNTSFLTAATTHLFEESLHGLIALGQPAVIDGSAIVGLSSGASWSGTPG